MEEEGKGEDKFFYHEGSWERFAGNVIVVFIEAVDIAMALGNTIIKAGLGLSAKGEIFAIVLIIIAGTNADDWQCFKYLCA